MIPRIIHQGWCGPRPMPERETAWCREMKQMNPGWEVRLYSNDLLERYRSDPYVAFLVDHGSEWAFVMDRLRCLLLRDEGGIWCDPDAQPIAPWSRLDAIWDSDATFAYGLRNPYRPGVAVLRGISLIDNTVLASAKNSRMIQRLLECWSPKVTEVNGGVIGRQIMIYTDHDCRALGFRYFYDHRVTPETIVLHDGHHLGSWNHDRTALQIARAGETIHV